MKMAVGKGLLAVVLEFALSACGGGDGRVGGQSPAPTSAVAVTTVPGAEFDLKSTGGPSGSEAWNLWANGDIEHVFSFNGPSTLVVAARGEPAAGIWPTMHVYVDDELVAHLAIESGTWQSYAFDLGQRSGDLPVRIAFTNDATHDGQDRNLHVRYVRIRTGAIPGSGGTHAALAPVERWGRLRVSGPNLVGENGEVVQLRGMSSHGLQWFGSYMNEDSIRWFRDDWHASVVRAAMYTASGGYISNPSVKDKVIEIVDAAIELGIYVIIDWHILSDGDPNLYKDEAIAFFQEMATRYGDYPNVIYEIANEPNGSITWHGDIRPYAVDVVDAIRVIDPDNLIIVGTNTWSTDIHVAAEFPLSDPNVAYALHFYAGSHGEWLRKRIDYVRALAVPVFVTEWGVSDASGGGGVFEEQTRTWINFLNDRNVSWVNWNVSDKDESSAALAPGASRRGGWDASELSPSGRLVRALMRAE
jgi:aryl-phospho-beta-D-glucosidase BglC (GH1 family)